MKRMMMVFACAACTFAMTTAAALPDWATGVFTGTVKNWCYDEPSDIWQGTATLTVAADGKVSGTIAFEDGAGGKAVENGNIESASDSEVSLTARFKWYDEKGKTEGSTTSRMVITRGSSGVKMKFLDSDDDCPVEGMLNRTGVMATIPDEWRKVRTLRGVAIRALRPPYNIQGIFELKCGKANKKGEAKVSAVLTRLDGKKSQYKAKTVNVNSETVLVEFNGLSLAIRGDYFSGGEGLPGGLSVETANVGGNLGKDTATVTVDTGDVSMFGGTVLSDLLPKDVPFIAAGGKWKFAKVAKVKLSKDKTKVELDTSNGKTNLSGIKLTYMPKKGTFKGSFKVYALEGGKLKKYSVKVSGVVVDGVGSGLATCKKPAVSWGMTLQ